MTRIPVQEDGLRLPLSIQSSTGPNFYQVFHMESITLIEKIREDRFGTFGRVMAVEETKVIWVVSVH